jgi:hypothetical protein
MSPVRWFFNCKQHRRSANTRSWSEAEEGKRELVDQLSGRVVETVATAEWTSGQPWMCSSRRSRQKV